MLWQGCGRQDKVASDSSCLPPCESQESAHFSRLPSPSQCPRSPLSDLNNILKAGCKSGPGFSNLFLSTSFSFSSFHTG